MGSRKKSLKPPSPMKLNTASLEGSFGILFITHLCICLEKGQSGATLGEAVGADFSLLQSAWSRGRFELFGLIVALVAPKTRGHVTCLQVGTVVRLLAW